jgi:EAL domain-containing protein (putative c-di-GMP-specific phosphodiesterase class I)
MSNPERSLNVLRKIHDIGVSIVIDDFGTGYSSLAYLQKLPVDGLKIDRSFVVEMDREDDTRPIINSIIEMAHNLGITVTAEGIESRQIMAKLAGMNCDFAQGYHISEPLAADSVLAWLRQNVPDTQSLSSTRDEPS